MQLTMTGHHVEVTEALQQYVNKKLERITRHFDQVLDVHCTLSIEKQNQIAEATVHAKGVHLHADASDINMYAAIDHLVDKLDRMVKKHKEKQSDHHAASVQRGRQA